MKRILYLLILASIATLAFAQQDPAPGATQPNQEDAQGVITGKVVSAKTGEPLPATRITLVSEMRGRMRGQPLQREGFSGADGSFVFSELPPGSYVLFSDKTGYTQGFAAAETRVRLGPKQAREITIRLPPASVVTGRVVDAYGEPLPEARVVALFRNFRGTWNQWASGAEAHTDDRGEYRITGLPGPRFIIAAQPPNQPSPDGVAYREFADVFYPGVDRAEQATFFKPAPGEEINGIDFKLGLAAEGGIEGIVVDGASGKPCDSCRVSLLGSTGLWVLDTSPTREGIFVMRGATPGEGWLMTRVNGPSPELRSEKVTVPQSGAVEVRIVLAKGQPLSGEVVLENPPKVEEQEQEQQAQEGPGQQRRQRPRNMIMLQPDTPGFARNLRAIVPEEGGAFEIESVQPGTYRLRFSGMNMMSSRGYVRAISIDGRELPSPEVTMPEGPLSGLKVHIAFDGASLAGAVKIPEKATGTPSSSAFVILVPDGTADPYQERQMISIELEDGTFNQANIRPGRYTAYALPSAQLDLEDPEVHAALEPVAKKITLAKNEKAMLELTLAPELP